MHEAITPVPVEELVASYPIALPVRYQLADGEEGVGWTISMSRKTVVFDAPTTLPVGTAVRLWIDWPVKLKDSGVLIFDVRGKTIPGTHATVEILGQAFRRD